jgi:hypothetical protein
VKNLVLVPFALLVVGCASSWEPVPTEYVFKDRPSEGRVEVLFTNDTENQLCLLPDHWPNQAGKINQASDYVFLLVAGERFPIEDFNTGYCPGGCALVVHPGETVSSSIAYDDFQLPDDLRRAPKQLELPVVAYTCPR